jgi:hypothetical protein
VGTVISPDERYSLDVFDTGYDEFLVYIKSTGFIPDTSHKNSSVDRRIALKGHFGIRVLRRRVAYDSN